MTEEKSETLTKEPVSLEALIAGPLIAAVEANASMALAQTKFLLDHCFTKEGETYKPIMIGMALTRTVLNPGSPDQPNDYKTTQMTTSFNIPLLTIVPLNSLAVQTVEISFDAEIKDISFPAKEDAINTLADIQIPDIKAYARYEGASDTATPLNKHIKISISCGQLPLPQGVLTVISAFTQSIAPIEAPV